MTEPLTPAEPADTDPVASAGWSDDDLLALGEPVEVVVNWFEEQEVDAPTTAVVPTSTRRRSSSQRSSSQRSSANGKKAATKQVPPAPRPRKPKRPARTIGPLSQADAIVLFVAVLGGVSAAASGARPTGYMLVDIAICAVVGFAITFMSAQGRRWSWLVMAGITAAASQDALTLLFGWSALLVAVVCIAIDSRRRWAGALTGLLATTALFRLGAVGPQGVSALIGIAAVLPVVCSSYRRHGHAMRKRILVVGAAVAGIITVMVAGAVVGALLSAGHADTAVTEADAGVASAKAGDDAATNEHLTKATAEFAAAGDAINAWYALPARVLPIVGRQEAAVSDMADVGENLTIIATDTAKRANYRNVAMVDGRVDVAKITALEAPLVDVQNGLIEARSSTDAIDTQWLIPPLRDRFDDLHVQLADALTETETAVAAVRVAPDLLGENGARHYFVAFTTPAESRGLGGFMGNWAILTADHGRLQLTQSGRTTDLLWKQKDPPRHLEAPADYIDRYGSLHPENEVRDATFSPDFPSVAQALSSIYPQTEDGIAVDGVLALDPFTLAAILKITGPIKVEGMETPLTHENAADILLRKQYETFDSKEDRVDFLDEAAHETFEAFLHAKSLRPVQLANVLGPMVEQRRFLAYSANPTEEALIERVGMAGNFPDRDGGDLMTLVTQNAGNNKIDVFLKRKVDYRAAHDTSTGTINATATITLHNDAPTAGLPDYVIGSRPEHNVPKGTNYTWFNFYSPHDLVSATLDGKPLAVQPKLEFGVHVYSAFLPIPPGGDAVIELKLAGALTPGTEYRLTGYRQPTVNADVISAWVNDERVTMSFPPR